MLYRDYRNWRRKDGRKKESKGKEKRNRERLKETTQSYNIVEEVPGSNVFWPVLSPGYSVPLRTSLAMPPLPTEQVDFLFPPPVCSLSLPMSLLKKGLLSSFQPYSHFSLFLFLSHTLSLPSFAFHNTLNKLYANSLCIVCLSGSHSPRLPQRSSWLIYQGPLWD